MTPSPPRRAGKVAILAAGASLLMVVAVGFAWLADWRLVVVETSSMEPTVPENSLALVVPAAARTIERGDIVRFRDPSNRRNEVLHRVVRVVDQRGERAFETQGDANNAVDGLLVPDDDLTGRLRLHIPKVGGIAGVLASRTGLLLLAGVPLLALAVTEATHRAAIRRTQEPLPGAVSPPQSR